MKFIFLQVQIVHNVLNLVTLLIKSFTLVFILKYISKLNLEHSKKLVVVVHAFQKTQKLIVKEMYRDLFIAYMHSHCAQERDKRGSTRRVSHCSTQRSLCHCSIREFEKFPAAGNFSNSLILLWQRECCVEQWLALRAEPLLSLFCAQWLCMYAINKSLYISLTINF